MSSSLLFYSSLESLVRPDSKQHQILILFQVLQTFKFMRGKLFAFNHKEGESKFHCCCHVFCKEESSCMWVSVGGYNSDNVFLVDSVFHSIDEV